MECPQAAGRLSSVSSIWGIVEKGSQLRPRGCRRLHGGPAEHFRCGGQKPTLNSRRGLVRLRRTRGTGLLWQGVDLKRLGPVHLTART